MSRETIETVDGRVYFSDDNWATVWKRYGQHSREVTLKAEADLARSLAIYKYGGGRDEPTSPASRPRSGRPSRASKRP